MLLPLDDIRTVGLIGAGSIGRGWAALLLASGYEVLATDRDLALAAPLEAHVRAVWPTLIRLGATTAEAPPLEHLRFLGSIAEVAAASDLVHENVLEDPAVKRPVLAEIDTALPPDRLILSSSGGTPPSMLQGFCRSPERCLVGHPFHPAHIVPLVEVVSTPANPQAAVDLALGYFRRLGKRPIHVRKEMVGHLANRLQFALLREAVHCLREGVASASDIDSAIRDGLGPRWAMVGGLMTLNLSGGRGGIEAILDKFAPDLQRWWDALGTASLFDDETRKALVAGAADLRRGHSNADWESYRDDALIAFHRFAAGVPMPAAQADDDEEGIVR